MSNSVQPHRWQPTRLPHPWDSPGKNIGVGCHFLLQCMKVKSESEVAQSCLTLSDLVNCSLPGSSVHGIFQARVLEWGAIAFSEIASYPNFKNLTCCKKEFEKKNWKSSLIIFLLRNTMFSSVLGLRDCFTKPFILSMRTPEAEKLNHLPKVTMLVISKT